MKLSPTIFLIILNLSLSLLMPISSFSAPYKYTYTGNNFTDIWDYTPPEGSYTESNRVTFNFITTIDGPLPDMGYGYIGDKIASFTFFDGRQEITEGDTYLSMASAQIVNGMITLQWRFNAINNGNEIRTSSHYSTGNGDYATISGPNGDDRGSVSSLGSWKASPVPIPGAVWLLGSGLIGLVGMRKKIK